MKKIIILLLCSIAGNCHSQLLINIDPVPQGMITKNQLWSMTILNNGGNTKYLQLELIVSEISSGAPVLSASTNTISITLGSHHLNAAQLGAINYLTMNSDYRIDNNANGLMPIGDFKLTYNIYTVFGDKRVPAGQEVARLQIPPAAPPVLQSPANKAAIDSKIPVFTWLPPSPLQLLTNVNYDIKISEVYEGQSYSDAILNNPKYAFSSNILNATFNYPTTARSLSAGKLFVWQVIAKQGSVEIAKSEIWSFKIAQPITVDKSGSASFVKLKKSTEDNYTVFFKDVKFEYTNETVDSVWKTLCEDITSTKHNSFVLDIKTPLKKGPNLVTYPASYDNRFLSDHIYVLKILNSRNELWQIKFQYKNQ